VPVVSWLAVGAGWGVAVANSALAGWMNRRAVGAGRGAFIRWGLVANSFRVLTLMGIFAYILFSYREERGSFFISVFTSFFILMLVEVADLFRSQANTRSGFECVESDKCGGCRGVGAGEK
jgi:hypothetical protein